MSILNVFVTPEAGLIGVDTESTLPDGTIQEFGKMIVAPAAGAVVAFRGTDYVVMAASNSIVCFGGSLEAMAEALPDHLRRSVDFCREHYQAPEEALGLELALVGYSQVEGCVVGHLFRRAIGSEEIQVDRIPIRYRAPFWDDLPNDIPADRPGMMTLAQHQSRLARERMPELAAGGRFLIAEVRRDSITIEKAFDFPPRQQEITP
ncbi:hypothetical protein [Metapseudomonas boanensis]|uniref:Uncharacterized protein n=1 Tax=Metapseudomonas boanensis TaxID=2822138 RepID=A0ABS5XHV2_9GAMM|nr:hypothetical protein [Pseudomonas boanensis]MBT8766868.1 hypothetical protein [Pseudomonas boanensis]